MISPKSGCCCVYVQGKKLVTLSLARSVYCVTIYIAQLREMGVLLCTHVRVQNVFLDRFCFCTCAQLAINIQLHERY